MVTGKKGDDGFLEHLFCHNEGAGLNCKTKRVPGSMTERWMKGDAADGCVDPVPGCDDRDFCSGQGILFSLIPGIFRQWPGN